MRVCFAALAGACVLLSVDTLPVDFFACIVLVCSSGGTCCSTVLGIDPPPASPTCIPFRLRLVSDDVDG